MQPVTQPELGELLTRLHVLEIGKISRSTLRRMEQRGQISPVRVSLRAVRYKAADVRRVFGI